MRGTHSTALPRTHFVVSPHGSGVYPVIVAKTGSVGCIDLVQGLTVMVSLCTMELLRLAAASSCDTSFGYIHIYSRAPAINAELLKPEMKTKYLVGAFCTSKRECGHGRAACFCASKPFRMRRLVQWLQVSAASVTLLNTANSRCLMILQHLFFSVSGILLHCKTENCTKWLHLFQSAHLTKQMSPLTALISRQRSP